MLKNASGNGGRRAIPTTSRRCQRPTSGPTNYRRRQRLVHRPACVGFTMRSASARRPIRTRSTDIEKGMALPPVLPGNGLSRTASTRSSQFPSRHSIRTMVGGNRVPAGTLDAVTVQSLPAHSPLFGCQNIDLTLGGRQILHNVEIEAHAGQILGVIGPNGAGTKTSLFEVLSGRYSGSNAARWTLEGRDISGYSIQQRVRAGIGRTLSKPGCAERPDGRRRFEGGNARRFIRA